MRTLADLSEAERRLVVELGRRLLAELPDIAMSSSRVFGSRARGDAEPDSDLDVLVQLGVDHLAFTDKQRLRRVATDLSIASGIIVSLLMVDRNTVRQRGDFSLFETVREEGIRV
jgi:predicted nucleotidyltransferase